MERATSEMSGNVRAIAWLLEMNTPDRFRTRDLLLQLGAFE
jgi:hypothetical protein